MAWGRANAAAAAEDATDAVVAAGSNQHLACKLRGRGVRGAARA